MGIDKNLANPVLWIVIEIISKQYVTDIKSMHGQMFVHPGGVCCDQWWGHYSRNVIIAHITHFA